VNSLIFSDIVRWWRLEADNKSRGSGRIVLPGGGQGTSALVVAGEAVDARLNKNQTELGVLVLAVLLKVLAYGHGLLDEEVQILGDLRSKTVALEDSQDLVASNALDLGNSMRITQDDADLRGRETLSGELADLVTKILRRDLEPRGRSAAVGQSRAGNTLARSVHATHD